MPLPTRTLRENSNSCGVYLFWRDPLCLSSWVLYFLNHFVLAPRFGGEVPFLREHLDDLLLVPAALPPFLWARERLRLRSLSGPPTPREIVVITLIASIAFEWLGPKYLGRSVGDWNDVAVYWVGAFVAGLWWNRHRFKRRHR